MHLYDNQVNIDEPKNAFKEIEAEGTLPKYFRNAELLSKPKEIKILEEKIQNKLPIIYLQKCPLKHHIEFISTFKYTYNIINDLINIYRILHPTNAQKIHSC